MANKRTVNPRVYFTRNTIIALVSLLTAITFVTARVQIPKPVGINEVSQSGTVTLSLPSTIPTTTTIDSTAPLTINTGGSKVTAVQIELTYDPNSLSNPTITPGTILPVELVKPKIAGDKIIVTLAVKPDSGGYSGEGVLANLKFRSKNSASSSISFTQNTLVAALGSSGNVLKAATGGTAQIAITPHTPSPSPTPAVTPLKTTPSPTPKHTVSPTIKPTPMTEPGSETLISSPPEANNNDAPLNNNDAPLEEPVASAVKYTVFQKAALGWRIILQRLVTLFR